MTAIAYRHTVFGLVFAIAGMVLGIVMASSHDHSQHVTHAHILLLGLVVSLLYASVYRLWLPDQASLMAHIQLWLHQVGSVVLMAGLFAMYGNLLPEPTLGPVLGIASVAVLTSAVLMLVIFVRAARPRQAGAGSDSARGIKSTLAES